MLDINKRLFALFHQNEVVYCNWKGTAKIEDTLNGKSDIDILVSSQSKTMTESLLKKAGFIKARTQWECRFKNIYDWLGCDTISGQLVHVHLHYRMIAGHPATMEYTLPWSEEVLTSRVFLNNGVYTIQPEWELLVLLTRLGLEYPNKKISNNTGVLNDSGLAELSYLRERVDVNQFKLLVDENLKSCAVFFMTLLQKETWDMGDFLVLKKTVIKEFKGSFYNKFYKSVSLIKSIITGRVIPMIPSFFMIPTKKTVSNGLVIAFLGQDGSGKSTVTKDVESWLNNKIEVSRFYLGSGKEYYYPWQRKLLDRLEKSNKKWSKPIRSWLYFSELLASSKYVLNTVKKANKYAKKGGIALLDRYPQVEYYGINDGPKIRVTLFDKVPKCLKWLASLYASVEENNIRKSIKYAPHVVFKLMLSPEVSKKRKPFENYEMIIKKHQIIKSLKFPSSQMEIINAEQPYDKELLLIKEIIWERLIKY